MLTFLAYSLITLHSLSAIALVIFVELCQRKKPPVTNGLPKEPHIIVIVDENPHREYRHEVRCEPTGAARGRVVYAASIEHSAAYLYHPADVLVAKCFGDELPTGLETGT